MRRGLIEELYFYELGNKDKLDARLPPQVAILSILGGMIYFAIREFAPTTPWVTVVFLALITISAGLYLGAIVMIYRGTFGHRYERLPLPSAIHGYGADLKKYYKDRPVEQGNVEEEFAEFISRHMIAATDRNTISNLTRSARYYTAMLFMAICVILALFASGLALGVDRVARDDKQEGAMTNEHEGTGSPNPTPGGEGGTPPTPPADSGGGAQPAEPASTKPPEPTNIIFKGNEEPVAIRVVHGVRGGRKETQ